MNSRQGLDRNKEQPESASHKDLAIEQDAKPRLHSESDIHSSIRRGSTRKQKTRGNESLTDDQSAEGGGRSSHRKYKRWEGKATRRQERPEIELNWRQHRRDSEPESNWRQGRSQDGAHHITYSHKSEIDSTSGYKKRKSYHMTTSPTKIVPQNFREAHDRGSHRYHTELRVPCSRPRVEKPTKHFLYIHSHIEELHQADDESVSRHITQNESGFLHAFKYDTFLKSPKILKQLVTILYKLQNSSDTQTVLRVLATLFGSSGEHALFMFHLQQLMREMVLEEETFIRKENLQLLYNLTEIGKVCFEKIPRTVQNSFPIQQIRATADSFAKYNTSNDAEDETLRSVEKNLQELEMQCSSFEEEQVKLKPKPHRPIGDEDIEPPEHYSTLPILPTPQEINDRAKKPYLRPNIVKGEYRDWQHYLDVQFRLLREDFVGPLREGVNEYLHNPKCSGGDIRVYRNVTIQKPACLGMGIGFDIFFKPLQGINWEHTNRLINGSLLCLSLDNFETIVFATVAYRDAKQLEQGNVTIKFEGTTDGFQLHSNAQYTMVESVAYLEAYRHVLEKLQDVGEEHENDMMPFHKYIVKCTFSSIPLPRYVNELESTSFDLKGIIEIKSKYTSSQVDLTRASSWPDADSTDLDPSQMKALQAALTQEISVIQGPPGTGKTYVGLKIVKAFLANRKVWDPKKTTPILVVCYTNHALDQFLEGIRSDMIEGKHPNVTRIGGRCKSEILKDCTLFEKVGKAKEDRAIPGQEYRDFQEARFHMLTHKDQIIEYLKQIHISTHKILRITDLYDVISSTHFEQLMGYEHSEHPIELWLGLLYAHPTDHEVPNSETQQVTEPPQLEMLEDENDDTEVQMIQDDRLVEGTQVVYRPEELDDDPEFEPVPRKLKQNKNNDGEWQTVQRSKKVKRRSIYKQLNRGLKAMEADEVASLSDLCSLEETQRWRLYLHWRDRYITDLRHRLERQSEDYVAACDEFQKKKQNVDMAIIQDSDIVGMTTTGAAKHKHIIKAIRPKIVVVEEAAEIFEPHIFTSLSPTVQQLVLIGDHQQLHPKPTYYELEKKYDFNVSLFERLAKNDCPVQTLNIQHRMRPEIASLITPAIYKELHNHESVLDYGHIQGVGKNLFFITHTEPELAGADDRRSHSNPHEAKYLGALCGYLLKQGYKPDEITILTLYRGQLLEIKNTLRLRKIKGVRTAVVDDFQGEENRIILLSLVRSNTEQKIGFVGIENRVCVALSRAKMSLFIIGNVEMLRDKVQTVWPKIIKRLSEMHMGSIGEALPLHCHIHQDQKIDARVAQDFLKCPEGGCQKKCDARLPCGHVCPKYCHPYDIEHRRYKCQKVCNKQLPCGHTCKYKCCQCSQKCQPCKEEVVRILPLCGHSESCYCSDNAAHLKCSKMCEKTLSCGHSCQNKCSQPCTYQCKVKVDKNLPCGHTTSDYCYINEDQIQCSRSCDTLLDCGHSCTGTCFKCSDGCLPCKVKVSKTLPCGHTQLCYCYADPEEIKCKKQCDKQLSCGHFCQKKCSQPCTVECPAQVDKCLPCGHTVPGPCYLRENLIECHTPCDTFLNCEHKCPGTCFSCKMGRLHVGCTYQCGRVLTCGHVCDFPCTPSCPPCTKPCANFCKHNSCPKMCFEPCAPCREPCDWSCPHFTCTQPCGMPCNRPPCNQPCREYLECGHRCIGLCGELCPQLCRTCHEDEVIELFFGNEDVRFILLPDCNHTFEVCGLDEWMSRESEDGAVTLKVCPKCSTPVRKCFRYNNIINNCLAGLEAIKKNQNCTINTIDLRAELLRLKDALDTSFAPRALIINEDLKPLEEKIQSNAIFPHVVKSKLSFLLQILRTYEILVRVDQSGAYKAPYKVPYKVLIQVEQIRNDLTVLKELLAKEFLSQQQLSDAESEMSRLNFLARLLELQSKLIPMRHQVSDEDKALLKQKITEFEESGWKREKISKQTEEETEEMIEEYKENYSIGKLSESERLEIVKAVGLPKGHWYKCPNGHYYVTGNCGGAMQRGRCPECNTDNGGMSHTLAIIP